MNRRSRRAGGGAAPGSASEPESDRTALLSDGTRAVLEPDVYFPGAWQLVVDGTPQSQVHPERPEELSFEYIRRIGHLIDLIEPAGGAITAVHLGAGALTLPRYIAATRPGSQQQVIELEPELVALVRRHLPLPQGAAIRVRYGDARAMLARLPAALQGRAECIVVDVFRGARTPAHVTSLEFYSELAALLAPTGVVAVNVADGPQLEATRRQAATLRAVFGEVVALAEPTVLRGGRIGNIVLAGSRRRLPERALARLVSLGPFPARALAGDELLGFIGDAAPITDAGTRLPQLPPLPRLFGR